MASQPGLDLAQARRAAKLPEQQRDQVGFAGRHPRIAVASTRLDKAVESRPRNLLHQAMKNGILVPHGLASFRVQISR